MCVFMSEACIYYICGWVREFRVDMCVIYLAMCGDFVVQFCFVCLTYFIVIYESIWVRGHMSGNLHATYIRMKQSPQTTHWWSHAHVHANIRMLYACAVCTLEGDIFLYMSSSDDFVKRSDKIRGNRTKNILPEVGHNWRVSSCNHSERKAL